MHIRSSPRMGELRRRGIIIIIKSYARDKLQQRHLMMNNVYVDLGAKSKSHYSYNDSKVVSSFLY